MDTLLDTGAVKSPSWPSPAPPLSDGVHGRVRDHFDQIGRGIRRHRVYYVTRHHSRNCQECSSGLRRDEEGESAPRSASAIGCRSHRNGSIASPRRRATSKLIHVDVARAKRELPAGARSAGPLTLSLVPQFVRWTIGLEGIKNTLNYGANRSVLRRRCRPGRGCARTSIVAAEDTPPDGLRVTYGITIEIEGGSAPGVRGRDARDPLSLSPGRE